MKFEFVEFYPFTEKNRGKISKLYVGTVHLYACDCELDLRGIRVVKKKDKFYFFTPQIYGIDHETGEKVKYPVFCWTNPKVKKEMMIFLQKEVVPLILQKLKMQKRSAIADAKI